MVFDYRLCSHNCCFSKCTLLYFNYFHTEANFQKNNFSTYHIIVQSCYKVNILFQFHIISSILLIVLLLHCLPFHRPRDGLLLKAPCCCKLDQLTVVCFGCLNIEINNSVNKSVDFAFLLFYLCVTSVGTILCVPIFRSKEHHLCV